MSTQNPKREVFGHIAELARTLGHAHRLELLEHLGQGERSVDALSQRTGLTLANASQHLQSLRRCGLVRSRRDGKRMIYSLTEGPLLAALAGLHRLAERNMVEVREIIATYFDKRDELDPISRDELMERLGDGSVVLLDVRPEDEFSLGHLPGAVNAPLADLERQLSELPPGKEIVAYCRGRYCVLAFEAVAALRGRGLKARRLEDGYPEWRAAGLPVEMA